VYGLGAKGNFASLVKAVKMGLPLPLAAIRNQRAFVSVQNLSSFIAFCLGRPMSGFEVFLVADNEQVSTPEFIRRLAGAAGTGAKLFAMPSPLLSAILRVAGLSSARESLIGSLQLDISKVLSTGWHPPFSLDEGLRLALHGTDSD
jgi:UDP-glucose 4-epimerase